MIEILIAIGILGFIVVGIFSAWHAVVSATRTGVRAAVEVQRARVALRAIEESLASAVMYADNGKYYGFFADTSGNHAYLNFVARLPDSFPGGGMFADQPVRRVQFEVAGKQLVLRQSPLLEGLKKGEQPYTVILSPNVKTFEVEFYDPFANKWTPEWFSTNSLPKLMRLALSFGEDKGTAVTLRTINLTSTPITRAGAGGARAGAGRPGTRGTDPGGVIGAGAPGTDELSPWGMSLPDFYGRGTGYGSRDRSSYFPE